MRDGTEPNESELGLEEFNNYSPAEKAKVLERINDRFDAVMTWEEALKQGYVKKEEERRKKTALEKGLPESASWEDINESFRDETRQYRIEEFGLPADTSYEDAENFKRLFDEEYRNQYIDHYQLPKDVTESRIMELRGRMEFYPNIEKVIQSVFKKLRETRDTELEQNTTFREFEGQLKRIQKKYLEKHGYTEETATLATIEEISIKERQKTNLPENASWFEIAAADTDA